MNDLPKVPDQPTNADLKPVHRKKLPLLIMAFGLALLLVLTWYVWQRGNEKDSPASENDTQIPEETPKAEPSLTDETLVSGHANIWDVAFADSKTLIYTVRSGEIWGYSQETKEKWQIAKLNNVFVSGESGLLGLTLDNEFASNGFAYICYDAAGSKRVTKVARFTLSQDRKSLSDFKDVVADIQSQGGRHSGCRMAMDRQNILWVGTGDSAIDSSPQDPKSLAGKVLRVNRDGSAAMGNMADPFDSRIYNYGHRNIQGLVLFDEPAPNGAMGFTSEHGPGKEDEINWLLPGNFGWNPASPSRVYNENVPMTDTVKYPDAIPAVWNSGSSTIAPSGLTILKSDHWSAWQNRVVLAVLKDRHLRLIDIDADGKVNSEKELFKNEFGRIRSVREGPDGNLYITTDNGSDDKIIRITPTTSF